MKNLISAIGVAMGACCIFTPALAVDECGSIGTIIGENGGKLITLRTRVFSDGSIVVRAPLAVNPDGGAGAYTVDDHGFTYTANGLVPWSPSTHKPCDSFCAASFRSAEKVGFGKGTAEFCVFAMTVEPFELGQKITSCKGGNVVGNGKGRLALGNMLDTVGVAKIQSYVSTTSLQHLVSGKREYLDSEALPIAVTPVPGLLGTVVWLAGQGMHGTFAVIGDSGPAFGEGSIAFHQLLRRGSVSKQKPGPIPVDKRCAEAETALQPPFQSRPDGGPSDRCRAGFTAKTLSDVRAYVGVDKPLDFIVLGSAAFKLDGNTIQSEVTTKSITDLAQGRGYTPEKIAHMLSCLSK